MQSPNYVRISLIAVCSVFMAFLLIAADAINHLAYTLPEMVQSEMDLTRKELLTEVVLTRAALVLEIRDTRVALNETINTHATAARKDLNWQLEGAVVRLDDRLKETNWVINNALREYDKTALAIGQVALGQTGALTERFLEMEPTYRSRFLAFTGEANRMLDAHRRMAETANKEFPALVENINQAVENTAKITANVEAYTNPKGFWRAGVLTFIRALNFNVF